MAHFTTDDGLSVHFYDTGGSKPPVVFIHGWTSSGFDWMLPMQALRRRYRCIAIDLRGHGRTPAQAPLTIERLAQDVHQLITHLGLERPALVGWSMGGLVTFEYLTQFGHAHLRGVTLVDQSPRMQTDADWQMGLFGDYTPAHIDTLTELFHQDVRRVYRRFAMGIIHPQRRVLRFAGWALAQLRPRINAEALLALAHAMGPCDYRTLLPGVGLPVLLCYGGASWLYPGEVGTYLAGQLPDATLVRFERSGHCPPIEEPRKFVRTLGTFLARLDTPGAAQSALLAS